MTISMNNLFWLKLILNGEQINNLMGAALALLSIFFIQQNQDGLHINSAVLKMAIKSLFLDQFPCVIYHFFQNFVLVHMFPFC